MTRPAVAASRLLSTMSLVAARVPRDFPATESRLVVRQSGQSLPPGLRPERTIETNGTGYLSLDRVAEGGFDALELAARHRIEFDGDAEMTLNRRLVLDAQTVAASANVSLLKFTVPYFMRANSWGAQDPVTALPGSATFQVDSKFVDLQGHAGFDGFDKVALNAER
jgi:hypothetical protein